MSRLNLNNLHEVNHMDQEKQNLDEYVWSFRPDTEGSKRQVLYDAVCRECLDYVFEYCSIHGPLLVLPDEKVPTEVNFPPHVLRASLTIPSAFLHLAPSTIPGAGVGVFSSLTLPAGIRFGPYQGKITKSVESAYCWQVYDKDNRPSHVVDAADAERSNWMRYVNCSRLWCEQNLLAYQYKRQVYYRTIKMIPQFTELLVFYGSEFANALNIDLKLYNTPPQVYYENLSKEPIEIELKNNQYLKNSALVPDIDKSFKNEVEADIKPKRNRIEIFDMNKQKSKEQIYKENSVITHTINTITEEFEYSEGDKEVSIKDVLADYILECIKTTDAPIINYDFTNPYISKSSISLAYNCYKCTFTTNQKRYMISHLKMHNLTNVFSCAICAYKCSYRSKLQRHMKIHTNNKSFPYTYQLESSVKIGLKDHAIEKPLTVKPFGCEYCQYSCKDKSRLIEHIRTHTGEKPFACNICNYRSAKNTTLMRHLRIHDTNLHLKQTYDDPKAQIINYF